MQYGRRNAIQKPKKKKAPPPIGSDAAWKQFVKKNASKKRAEQNQPVYRTIGAAKLSLAPAKVSPKQRSITNNDLSTKGDWGKRKDMSEEERRQRRAWGIWYLGGHCLKCGTTERLEFDHLDPAIKRTSQFLNWAQAAAKVELRRCQLLCYDCHKAKTDENKDRAYRIKHGTLRYALLHGCKCQECQIAKSLARKAARAISAQFHPPFGDWPGTKKYIDMFGY